MLLLIFPTHDYTAQYCKAAPLFVGICYVYALALGGKVEGASFTSLRGVTNIFRKGGDYVLSGCWQHYLAFDLLVGLAITQDSNALGISQLYMKPLVALTCMFGPAGFLAYGAMKLALFGQL